LIKYRKNGGRPVSSNNEPALRQIG